MPSEQFNSLPLEQQIGQFFFIGLPGTEIDSEARSLLDEVKPGGVIIFGRNVAQPEQLHLLPERHIPCNPALAQYIIDPEFPPLRCEGLFAKEQLDPTFVAEEEARVTRGWRRLRELPALGLPILEYPLPEVIAAWGERQLE